MPTNSRKPSTESRSGRTSRAVMYIRVGRAEHNSDSAVTAQRAACQRIATTYGATVVREYLDLGRPAQLEYQTELRRLLDDLAAHRDAAFVVISDYARLARDLGGLDTIIRRIRPAGLRSPR
ncbi:hypothetical protein DMH04_25505 [Kibdelosporangium aridum]|uniref:Resolvase/invertase-type recombinase catalytic domain-containing protein n=1 Tax=Kibdelosporangium aridum TaxID=2030 RepID=A0A428Z650_KIBAR|nr:hypothetical protein DMH04_25505 [Kibdelosporangium aridum]